MGPDRGGRKADVLDKEQLLYTIMIRQPDFTTEEVAYRPLKRFEENRIRCWMK